MELGTSFIHNEKTIADSMNGRSKYGNVQEVGYVTIPSVGPSLPAFNPASVAAGAKAAEALSQSAQNVQAAVNEAAANMGARAQTSVSGTPLAPNSAAAGAMFAGLQSAQTSTEQAAGKPAPSSSGGTSQTAQLLPNTPASSTKMDSALFSQNTWASAAQGQKGATTTGSMARMLQSFSQSTVAPGTTTVSTSSGQAQLISPGQGASLYAAGQTAQTAQTGQGVPTTVPGNPNAAGTGNANPGMPFTNPAAGEMPPPAKAAVANPNAAAQSGTQTTAGAATLRAEGAQNTQTASQTSAKPTTLGAPPVPTQPLVEARAEATVRQQVQAAVQAAQTQPATEGKSLAHQQGANPRTQAAPDASMAGMPAPMTTPDPAPKSGQLGVPTVDNESNPLVMSQVAAASGFSARLQQSLNLNLGIPGLTPGNLLSATGLIILALVIMRVFVNGVVPEEVVGLSFAAIIGIMMMAAPWVMKPKP